MDGYEINHFHDVVVVHGATLEESFPFECRVYWFMM